MKTFTPEEYKQFQKNTPFKQEKLVLLKKYNKQNQTNFEYIYEAIHKLREEGLNCQEIGDIFKTTKSFPRLCLVRMGINRPPKGGKKPELYITYNHQTKSIIEFADEYNIKYNTLYNRIILYGWDIESALTKKIRKTLPIFDKKV